MHGLLALEDGTLFSGRAFGSIFGAGGEVVFNTSMTGYQEVLTDPSYHGQIVVFTAAHVGNYGIHAEQDESGGLQVAGVVVREVCEFSSHPAAAGSLPALLRNQGLFGLTGVDTRALTLHLRRRGTLRGWLTTEIADPEDAVRCAQAVPRMQEIEAVAAVTSPAPWYWENGTGVAGSHHPSAPRVAVLDCGVKRHILRELGIRGCRVGVFPADTEPEGIDAFAPDGIVLSNGPGDPATLASFLPRILRLIENRPTLAICLGHQLAALAVGGRTTRLPFGHHGSNHPVQELATGRVLITSQNHNYTVEPDSLPRELVLTHRNLNDGTVEGFKHRCLPLWSLQFHPEAAPGPHDAVRAFDEFVSALVR